MPAIPPWITGDPMRLRQVVLNLVGNAIKFTSQGQVTVRASIDRTERDRPFLRVEITDTGEGIAPEAQQRLFQQFVQADSSTSRRFGGTGLGLAISRQLVELMGGRIGLSSVPGMGSTFWFVVPALADASPGATRTRGAGAATRAPRPRWSRRCGSSPSTTTPSTVGWCRRSSRPASTGCGRWTVARRPWPRSHPNASTSCCSTCRCRSWTGRPACVTSVRSTAPMRDVPVIALTANAMAGDRERYLAEGFTDYVSKPMTMQSLADAMGRATLQRAG